MRFTTAFNRMQAGHRMRCPGFKGYWFWDTHLKTIIIVTKDNDFFDFRETDDVVLTLGFINSDEWEFYHGPTDPRENAEVVAFPTQQQTSLN